MPTFKPAPTLLNRSTQRSHLAGSGNNQLRRAGKSDKRRRKNRGKFPQGI
jgi:hypothetical protein